VGADEHRAVNGHVMSAARVVEAPAKVNLLLRVLGRRPDGYHDIETLFQAISLADEVTVRVGGPDGEAAGPAAGRVDLEVVGPDLGPPHENLVHRAATRFLETAGHSGRVRLRLVKRIPAGAGLGGGSSDAAAVLRCLADLVGGVGPDRLRAIAAELGSDVPFFLGPSPLAVGRGRGERLSALPALAPAHLVIALPPVHVSTASAYADLADERAGHASPTSSRGIEPEEVVLEEVARSWESVAQHPENDFQSGVAERHPEVRRSLEGLRAGGARWALLSGSGGAAFGVFDRREDADAAALRLEERLGWRFVVASTRTDMPSPRESTVRGDASAGPSSYGG
jgi:4-diphosphocytidyl-2-C-methyl-D-erythritol kinase